MTFDLADEVWPQYLMSYIVHLWDADVLDDGLDRPVVVAPLELGDDTGVGVFRVGVGFSVGVGVENAAHQEVDVSTSGAGEWRHWDYSCRCLGAT